MSKYDKSLPENSVNITSIFQYRNFINDYENNVKLEYLLVTLSEFNLDLDL